MIFLRGGHFAGMVIDLRGQAKKAHSQGSHAREIKILAHKTFHRYTVRRKNGGTQPSFGAAHSGRATIRIYNERALKLEVRDLLEGWSDWILQSECVFMHAPGNNKRTVFYEHSIMGRVDREGLLRSFPFVTRCLTLVELKRAYQELTTIKIMQLSKGEPLIEGTNQVQDQEMIVIPTKEPHTPVVSPSPAAGMDVAKVKTASMPSSSASILKLVELEYNQWRTPTLLHLASFHGQAQVVQQLLEKYGADPTATIPSLIKRMDKTNEPVPDELLDLAIHAKPWTAYDAAKAKETRNAFRRVMATMPDAWDWTGLARVHSALTSEMEAGSQKGSGSRFNGKRSENESDSKGEAV
ncbi:hypothetical protein BGX33_009330 [Mortierella sp. NVP41]|nr:hypothetical protein BGX33_009330 [Mortierella sp. NVP41]